MSWYKRENIELSGDATVEGELIHEGDKIGFFDATPAAQTSGYTQSYSTASRTLAAYTAPAEVTAYSACASTGQLAGLSDLNQLRTSFETLRAAVESNMKVTNSIVDDLQTYGLFQ